MAAQSQGPGRSKAQREFVSEAEELLERMQSNLADLEDQGEDGSEVDPELVNGLFRAAHSLKGLAGMFGHEAIATLSHHLENALDALRLGRATLGPTMVAVLRESAAEFGELLGGLGDAEAEEAAAPKIADLVVRIEAACEGEAPAEEGLDALALDPTLLRALTEYEEHRLRENLRRGRTILLVEATFEILSFDEGLAELGRAVREVGELISTLPSPGEAPESQIRFALLLASDVDADTLRSRLDFPHVSVRRVSDGAATAAPATPAPVDTSAVKPAEAPPTGTAEVSAVAESESPSPPPPSEDVPTPADGAEIESLRSISETVRVDIRKLDELMNLVGELVIQRSAIESVARRLMDEPGTARVGAELGKIYQGLDRKLRELQAGVLEVRMVPLRQVFEKLSRVARRLRRDLGKEVRLELNGADTELDKLIVEQLVDPLMHVVRNAFDHAIETPDERTAAGKDPEGSIRLDAYQRGNHVVIEVIDDGRGIDPDRIRARARELGLVSADQPISDREAFDLLFSAGFSTRTEVTATSGRGVGMDVVKANLTSFGGIVDLESVLGRGTKVTMTLPTTLAIIQALIVGAGDQTYAIPLTSVLETLVVEAGEIQKSDGRELMNLRGEALPLRRLTEEFELAPSPADSNNEFVVVLGLGGSRLGLVVDRLLGQEDAVIKPIQGPVTDVPGIAGATELGDQNAVLVLDITTFIEDVHRRKEAA
ncbi:MAG: chemotaxis protein CheA [Deltaproteobacteria bacterium]|nr:chemotaxis protein CheA [Deltaproteobacteria bacterium]